MHFVPSPLSTDSSNVLTCKTPESTLLFHYYCRTLSLFRFSLASYKFLLSNSSHIHAALLQPKIFAATEKCSQTAQLPPGLSYLLLRGMQIYLLASHQDCTQQSIPGLTVTDSIYRQMHKIWTRVQWVFTHASPRLQQWTAPGLCGQDGDFMFIPSM